LAEKPGLLAAAMYHAIYDGSGEKAYLLEPTDQRMCTLRRQYRQGRPVQSY